MVYFWGCNKSYFPPSENCHLTPSLGYDFVSFGFSCPGYLSSMTKRQSIGHFLECLLPGWITKWGRLFWYFVVYMVQHLNCEKCFS